MIVLVGESASGKSSIERELIALGFNKIVTYTTRPMRKEDVDGETYHFITEEQFNDMIEKDLFAEHASYNGWQYGTAKEDCTDDKVVVLTPHGLRQLKKNKDLHIISFYIDVPRRDRLIKILERGDDIEEAYRRNLSDVGQFDGIKDEVDYVISNKGYSWSPLNMAHIIKRSMDPNECLRSCKPKPSDSMPALLRIALSVLVRVDCDGGILFSVTNIWSSPDAFSPGDTVLSQSSCSFARFARGMTLIDLGRFGVSMSH